MSKAKQPTKLDYAILGLLKDRAMSGYEIRKIFETSAMGNYSSSPGAIYPALKRLERLYLVEKTTKATSGKPGFTMTSSGRESLKRWLVEPINGEEITRRLDEILLRFAFMDSLIPKERQIIFLEDFAHHLHLILKEMKTFYRIHGNTLPLNGKLAFENGLAIHEAHFGWAKKALKALKSAI